MNVVRPAHTDATTYRSDTKDSEMMIDQLEALGAEVAELDTDQANKKIWLLKVPNFLAQRWKGVCARSMNQQGASMVGPKLGTIRYARNAVDSTGKPQVNITLQLDSDATRDVPQEYNMTQASQSLGNMALLAFSERVGAVAAEGRVDHKFDLEVVRKIPTTAANGTVQIDPEYRQLSRQRHQAAATKTRMVQRFDGRTPALQRGVALIGTKRKEPADKRVAMPREELLRQLFTLFEKHPTWDLKRLQDRTEQPTMHLKNVLGEIAVQLKTGPSKGQWELKKSAQVTAVLPPGPL